MIIALPYKAVRIKKIFKKDSKWCYLGKDIFKREEISNILGEEKRDYLKDKIYRIAENFSKSYIEYIAELGKDQKNQLNWWASNFASKNHLQTDFYLLFCYKILAAKLIQKKIEHEELIIFVEDPWLFNDLKKMKKNGDVRFFGNSCLILRQVSFLIRGISKRFFLLWWLLLAYFITSFTFQIKKPKVINKVKRAVVGISPTERQAFKNGNYEDVFMPGLAEYYKTNQVSFFYLYLLRFPLSNIKYMFKNSEIIWPLILNIKFASIVKRIFERWKPKLRKNQINGYDVSELVKREKWLEISGAGFNLQLILYDTFKSFFNKLWCSSIVYIFENQPWEKMLCMAAKNNEIKLYGYQCSTIWKLYLAQFIGTEERSFIPLPNKLVISGKYFAELYKQGGIPEEKVVVGGAWRYSHLTTPLMDHHSQKTNYRSKAIALVALNLDFSITKSILENISKHILKHNLDKEIEIWIKPHPGNTDEQLSNLKSYFKKYRIVNKPFQQLIEDVDILISSSSTIGLEAFLFGKKVVLYIPENYIAADPLFDLEDERIYKWYEGDDLNETFFTNFDPIVNYKDINKARERFYSKIDDKIWLEEIAV